MNKNVLVDVTSVTTVEPNPERDNNNTISGEKFWILAYLDSQNILDSIVPVVISSKCIET